MKTTRWRHILHSQAGQSMAECLVVLPVALFLIFAAIQFALLYHAKITLNYASFEAVRAGTLHNADYDSVKEGFMRGLAPLYSYYEPDADKRKDMDEPALNQVSAFQKARRMIFEEFKDPRGLVQITRINPDEKDFADHQVDEQIPNDNLMYRAAQEGTQSNNSIQDANILHLRITYWYPLYVPLVNKFIHKAVCAGDTWSRKEACADTDENTANPRFPLTVVTAMRMQSAAKESDGFAKLE